MDKASFKTLRREIKRFLEEQKVDDETAKSERSGRLLQPDIV
jgi:hypothetical protein